MCKLSPFKPLLLQEVYVLYEVGKRKRSVPQKQGFRSNRPELQGFRDVKE